MYRQFEDMVWPAPGVRMDDLEWNLRYAPQEADFLLAASVIAAYQALVSLPERKRNKVISELRLGPNIGV
jgi:hypothetical protein